jgi:preprotein translocase subunit SecA
MHLLEMDHLKEGINLRGYAQKNPLHEYQKEGFLMFQRMIKTVKLDVLRKLFSVRMLSEAEVKAIEEAEAKKRAEQERRMAAVHAESASSEVAVGDIARDPSIEREKLKEARKQRRRLTK